MIGLTFLLGATAWSRRVGLLAALALGAIPRLFHDAHLACFDVPIAALQLLVLYAYWRGSSTAAGPSPAAPPSVSRCRPSTTPLHPVVLLLHHAARLFGPRPRPPLLPSAAVGDGHRGRSSSSCTGRSCG